MILINGNSGDISGGHIPLNIKDFNKPSKNIKLLFDRVFVCIFQNIIHFGIFL